MASLIEQYADKQHKKIGELQAQLARKDDEIRRLKTLVEGLATYGNAAFCIAEQSRVEDGGDRVYLSSTNDRDLLIEAWHAFAYDEYVMAALENSDADE